MIDYIYIYYMYSSISSEICIFIYLYCVGVNYSLLCVCQASSNAYCSHKLKHLFTSRNLPGCNIPVRSLV